MERVLLESARRAGLGQGESIATIRSGIDAGVLQPRDLNGVGYPGLPPSSNGDGHREPDDNRPAIEITTERHHVLEEALLALIGDRDLYRRGDSLGIVIEEGKPAAKLTAGIELRNAQGSARFIALSDANVSCFLTRNARFFRWKTDRNGEPVTVDCHPPDWLIQAIASRGYWPGIRPLLTITSCPFVRPDGSVPAPGYDEATGTLFRPNVELRPLPDRLTREEARDAAKRLYHLVRQFPFASDSDRAVWLAALLTAVQRPTIAGPVPGFAFNGNKAGIGKGLLIDTLGVLAWGHCIPTRTYPADPVEAGKVEALARPGGHRRRAFRQPAGGRAVRQFRARLGPHVRRRSAAASSARAGRPARYRSDRSGRSRATTSVPRGMPIDVGSPLISGRISSPLTNALTSKIGTSWRPSATGVPSCCVMS